MMFKAVVLSFFPLFSIPLECNHAQRNGGNLQDTSTVNLLFLFLPPSFCITFVLPDTLCLTLTPGWVPALVIKL